MAITDSAGCRDTSAAYNYTVTPVTLLNFTAYYNGKDANLLNWQTAQEINSSKFNIQRAYILPQFATIATLPAAGNSSTTKDYAYTDNNILYQPTFYRLQQVDKDGKLQYSKTIMVHPVKNDFAIGNVYPNPTRNILNIEFSSASSLPVTVLITDMPGRAVQKTIIPVATGFNKASINTGALAKGRYVLRLMNEEACVQKGFVKF